MTTWGPSTWVWPQVAPFYGWVRRKLPLVHWPSREDTPNKTWDLIRQAHYFSATPAQVKLRLLRNISSLIYKSYFPTWVVTLHTELCRWAPRFTNTCTVCEELLRWFIQFLNFALFYFFKKTTRLLFGKFFYKLILLYRSSFFSEFSSR
jgi:hypothetical protein